MVWVMLGVFAALTAAVWWAFSRYANEALAPRVDREQMLRRRRQAFGIFGLWELGISYFIAAGTPAGWASATGTIGMGLCFIGYGTHRIWTPWLLRRTRSR